MPERTIAMNRRTVLVSLAAGLGAHALCTDWSSGIAHAQPVPGMPHLLFKDDPQFWFETLRVIGAADYGGGQFGEAVMSASRIKAGDYDSWHDEWKAAADRVSREARSEEHTSELQSLRHLVCRL